MAHFAIIETGGKQYKVAAGLKIKIPKLPDAPNGSVLFDRVLLSADAGGVRVGTPYVSGAAVRGTVVRNGRDRKIIVFRYHSKTRYRKKKGHRQHFSEIRIDSL